MARMIMLRGSVVAACAAAAMLAFGSAAAQASSLAAQTSSPPLWYVQQTGAFVPLAENSGMEEIPAPETMIGLGNIEVTSGRVSECISRERQLIEDPPMAIIPGSGAMEEFELLCEKGTGAANEAEAPPCVNGEPFEVRATHLNWAATLEEGPKVKNQKFYEYFPHVSVEVFCTRSREHDEYSGSLRPEMALGKLIFVGASTGVLEDSAHHSLNLKGREFLEVPNYKAVRAGIEL